MGHDGFVLAVFLDPEDRAGVEPAAMPADGAREAVEILN
jgi:hypothetical protein